MEGNETAIAVLPHTCQLWLQQIHNHIYELFQLKRSFEGLSFGVFLLYPKRFYVGLPQPSVI